MTGMKYILQLASRRWVLLLLSSGFLITLVSIEPSWAQGAFDDSKIVEADQRLLELIEGSLGALIMIVAGLVAIIAAAMGTYRTAMAALVVAIGAFILRSLVTLFFDVSL